MWTYEKKLQFPVNIRKPDPAFAKIVISQIGGPDGELAASMRYLNQRYAMPYDSVRAMLTDIGTEELAHLEMVSAILYQLTRNLSVEEIKAGGLMHIMLTIQPAYGHRQPAEHHLLLHITNPKAIRLLICLRTWQQNRKHGQPMKI